ncbi:Hypothetical predicted protein [Pelobates cultripes]|uniref:Uncharacterized protein n=1 Tax=Pelobates cultripes TaxID=61616 RepID=A0AAD1TBH4_PELCU|nr:Hypothetical predicted protein [Pelobates cultripes]
MATEPDRQTISMRTRSPPPLGGDPGSHSTAAPGGHDIPGRNEGPKPKAKMAAATCEEPTYRARNRPLISAA